MRHCGDCQLCCKLLPVREIDKKANEKCKHQKFGKGCNIYATRPLSCKIWSCGWLIDPEAHNLRRPDKSHYVVDLTADFVTTINEETGEQQRHDVVQVWCDPKYPRAFDDPELKDYVLRTLGIAIIRYNSEKGLVLVYDFISGTWLEKESRMK